MNIEQIIAFRQQLPPCTCSPQHTRCAACRAWNARAYQRSPQAVDEDASVDLLLTPYADTLLELRQSIVELKQVERRLKTKAKHPEGLDASEAALLCAVQGMLTEKRKAREQLTHSNRKGLFHA